MSLPTMLLQICGKMLYLPIPAFSVSKYSREFGANIKMGSRGKGTPGRTILTNKMCACPCLGGPMCDKEKCGGGITIDRASMSCSTSSQMCGSWYLPRFLFRGGLLTLMNMASFMVLVIPWDSLSMMEKLSMVLVWS